MFDPFVVLGPLDLAVLGAAALLIILVGVRSTRAGRSSSAEFLAAGRSLTLPVFVATLVSTWYGGILGIGEFAWRYGISTWVVFGLPYYVFAILFALVLAPKIRRSNVLSLPDRLQQQYGRPTALAGSILTFLLVNPAPYALMLGLLSQMFFGGPLWMHLLLGLLLAGGFLLLGGFRSGVMSNVVEFVMMYVGFAVMVSLALPAVGGWSELIRTLPAGHVTPFGSHEPQVIIVWFLIALWTIVDPSFHQRSAAAKDEKTARRGILVSVLFWFLFDAMTVTTGMIARAMLPELDDPALAYPALAMLVLPDGLRGVFFVGLLATVISTLTSMLMLGGLTAGRDLAARWKGMGDEGQVTRWVRVGTAASGLIAAALAWLMPSVVSLWYAVGTSLIPGLLIPALGSYIPAFWVRGRTMLTLMVAGSALSTADLVWGQVYAVNGVRAYWWSVEPLLPGLAVTILIWIAGKWHERRDSAR